MKKLGSKGMKLMKLLHLVAAFLWVGGALSMMLILTWFHPETPYEMYMFAHTLKVIDDIMIIYGAYGFLVSGVLYGVFTHWGFFKHKWVTVKWVLTIAMILSGTFLMGPCVNGNALPMEELARYTTEADVFWANVAQITRWGWVQIALMTITVIISVYKPWKSRKTSKRAA